ncbi:CoA transferase [Saccharopolyspora sp. 6V]|uniref:CoA transferase n=1 Tax=Saccharopolyspora sp. 6V TaxID=2877239 RepID=UPI001CD68BC7|nr:CoA transferase [Saccharopolyspora sp. 6V]MCA1191935.1 CoA transferase [Saccharopolyspora sp. 6V]
MSGAPTSERAAARVAAEVRDALRGEPDVTCEIDWSGPVRAVLPDEDAVQAACGIMQVHGRAAGRPAALGVDYASVVAGVLASQGELAAAIARARGARVSRVRTSVAEAALLAVQQYLAVAATESDDAEPRADPGGGPRPPFTTADGVRCELETLDAEPWLRFWRTLGAGNAAISRGWGPFQQRFGTACCPLPPELHEVVGRTRFAEVLAAAAESGVAVLPVREDPVPPWEVPACTTTPLGSAGAPLRPRGAPAAGPLDGLVVVESTRRVQGPVAGHVLRMLGAEVVRVEPPGGDPMRGIPPTAGGTSVRYRSLNDGKRVVEVDIKSAAGRRAVHELVADAEVFVHNWAPGKAAQLGLDADDLARSAPGLVYAWASGWGGAAGPNPPLGTDFLVQVGGGLAAALSPAGAPVRPSLMTLTDVLGGLVCAHGVLRALLRRVRTGAGARVDTSLFSAAGLVPRAPRARPDPLRGPLRTADGSLVLPRGIDPATATAAFGGAPGELPTRFRERTTGEWVHRGAAAGLVVTPVCADLRDLTTDDRFGAALGRAEHVFPLPPWEFS